MFPLGPAVSEQTSELQISLDVPEWVERRKGSAARRTAGWGNPAVEGA